ncbi:MAG: hypothetical protein AAF353_12305, partial [Pseudomonadota bacterium]
LRFLTRAHIFTVQYTECMSDPGKKEPICFNPEVSAAYWQLKLLRFIKRLASGWLAEPVQQI